MHQQAGITARRPVEELVTIIWREQRVSGKMAGEDRIAVGEVQSLKIHDVHKKPAPYDV